MGLSSSLAATSATSFERRQVPGSEAAETKKIRLSETCPAGPK